MNPPIIVGFDVTERTINLQFDEDIVSLGFTIGDKFDLDTKVSPGSFLDRLRKINCELINKNRQLQAQLATEIAVRSSGGGHKMSDLHGEHYCKKHQGNTSHYDERNCTVCRLEKELAEARAEVQLLTKCREELYDWLKESRDNLTETRTKIAQLEQERDDCKATYTPFVPDVKILKALKNFLALAGSFPGNSLTSNRLALIKGVRAVTGLGTDDAKNLVEEAETAAKSNHKHFI